MNFRARLLLSICCIGSAGSQMAAGQSVDLCRPYSYSATDNVCFVEYVAPWWVVQNIEEHPGDVAQGRLGEGWKLSLVTDNPTDGFMAVEYELFGSQGGGVLSSPVLASLNGNLVAANGQSALRGLAGGTFAVPPHTSQRIWLISAADDQNHPLNDLLTGSMRVRISTHDAATMDQVGDRFNGTLGNYMKDAASGTLTTHFLGKLELRRVDTLTRRAYTDIVITPLEQRAGTIPREDAAIAIHNFSPQPQMVTVRLKGPDGDVLASTQLALAGGDVRGIGGQSTGILVDDLFPAAVFTLPGRIVFHGQVEVESAAPVALFVWHVIGEGATAIPWWSLP